MWISTEKLKRAVEAYNMAQDEPPVEDLYQKWQDTLAAYQARAQELGQNQQVDPDIKWSVFPSGYTGQAVSFNLHASIEFTTHDEQLTELYQSQEVARKAWNAERDRRRVGARRMAGLNRRGGNGRTHKELVLEIEAIGLRLEDHEGKTFNVKVDVARELGLI